MKCHATIIVEGDADKIDECMKQELVDYDRSSSKMEKVDGKLKFEVETKDAVALRATMNSITQSLAIFEKVAKKEL